MDIEGMSSATTVAKLMERLVRTSDAMESRQRRAMEQQEQTVQALPDVLRQAARQPLEHMAKDAKECLHGALNQPLAEIARTVAEHERLMQSSTAAMAQTQRRLMGMTHKGLWLVGGLLAIIVPVIATGAYLGWHYSRVISQHRIEADLLRAYNQADVRLCGESLCARVERRDKRYGEYVIVKPR